jgi:outer membrane beta-barrel protein
LAVPKRRALELGATIGVIPTDPLRVYVPVGVRAAFHIDEVWAIEAAFAYFLAAETSLAAVLDASGAEPRTWQRAQQQLRAHAALRVTPLYGKLLAGTTVLHMELYALAGGGIVRTLRTPSLNVDAGIRPSALLGAGFGLLFGSRWVIRLEYRQSMYLRPSSGLAWPAELGLCGGVLLGGRR